ncbi:MAG: aspartyl/glutamyl-tRNA amidotransferase subunit C [Thermoanaerobaculia bacterium]
MPKDPVASVTPDVVRRVAALARLRVPEDELARLTAQLARIVGYIDQIREIPRQDLPEISPLSATPVREDASRPGGGSRTLETNAPVLVHGYGSVPRVVGSPE